MKKNFILFIVLSLLFIPNIVKATSATVKIDAPSNVYVGDTVKVSVTLSSSSLMGAWQYTIGYDDSKLYLCSSCFTSETAEMVTNYNLKGQDSVTYSWTFKATNMGDASFNISSFVVGALNDDSSMDVTGSKSKTITIKNPAPVNNNGNSGNGNNNTPTYNYSNNNYLSSLTIEGFDLSFDKNTTDYSISVPNDTKKVSIGASAEDGKAKVSGIGEYDVKEGTNSISVVVKAENGDTRTYNLNVDVLELSPVEIELDGGKYYVVRKNDLLPLASISYNPSTVLIKGEEIPCYYSETAGIYLVGLKDESGHISLYQYDNVKDNFSNYIEVNVGNIYLSIVEANDSIKGYNKELIKINDKEINAYVKDGSYPLIYGKNIETGDVSYYSYDKEENTVQRFMLNGNNDSKVNFYIVYGLVGFIILQFIAMILIVISKNKKLRKILNNKLSVKTNYEKSLEINDEKANENVDDSYSENNTNDEESSDDDEMYKL